MTIKSGNFKVYKNSDMVAICEWDEREGHAVRLVPPPNHPVRANSINLFQYFSFGFVNFQFQFVFAHF